MEIKQFRGLLALFFFALFVVIMYRLFVVYNWYNALTVSTAKFLLPIIGAHLLFVYVGVRTFLVAFGDPEKTPRYMVLSVLGNILASLVTVVVMYSVKTIQKDPEIIAELWKSIALGALAIFYTCLSKQVRKAFLGGRRLNWKVL